MVGHSDDTRSNQWLRDAIEYRRAISDTLIALPDEYPAHTHIAFNEYHKDAQKFLFEYYSMFEPAKGQLGAALDLDEADDSEIKQSLWKAPIDTAEIPVSGRVRLNGHSDLLKGDTPTQEILPSIAHRIPTKPATVNLENIRRLFQGESDFQIQLDGWIENHGRAKQTITGRRYLSPSLIYQARLQLDKCLAKTGKVPDFTEDGRPYNDWRKEFDDGVYEGPDSVDLPHKDV